jgi:hypothetical protein
MTPVTISETVYPKKKRRVLERLSVTHVQTKSSKTLNVICPPNCHKAASVIGRSIYHPKTSVCAAAIVDNSIPFSGGMLGIIRASG